MIHYVSSYSSPMSAFLMRSNYYADQDIIEIKIRGKNETYYYVVRRVFFSDLFVKVFPTFCRNHRIS